MITVGQGGERLLLSAPWMITADVLIPTLVAFVQ